ncbi:MAG TPA: glycosyltransferase family 2 protein [Bryobacteraceae bacterium]|nr:glycosyltransferase family 2 protein [Bryobacteraceae bacterium]
MFVSVIICTYGRAKSLGPLLDCLLRQTFDELEILVVDGNDTLLARRAIEQLVGERDAGEKIRIIRSGRGLTRQRNAGMREARGNIFVFLDDDVTLDAAFISHTIELLERPDMRNVGGVTGYDMVTYGGPMAIRWRIRNLLGAIPSLVPGAIDHLGRAVPVSFVPPFSGCKEVGWLAGFCMIYRRDAVEGLQFDECLPTYGGEDRDFSIQVGKLWRLVFCGDLRLNHHGTPEGRESDVCRMLQNSFGAGRRFAKGVRGLSDYLIIARTLVGDLLVDLLAWAAHPSRSGLLIPIARIQGLIQGWRSVGSARTRAWDAAR